MMTNFIIHYSLFIIRYSIGLVSTKQNRLQNQNGIHQNAIFFSLVVVQVVSSVALQGKERNGIGYFLLNSL